MQATKSRLDVAGDSDEQETGSEISTNDPPEVIIDQFKIQNLPKGVTHLDDCQLPIDILLLTGEDCEFLSCLSYLNPGFCRTFYEDLGFVILGDMGEDERKLNIAVMNCYRGSASPGGSMIVVLNAVNILRPKAVFCVGSCRSLDYNKVKLGDLIMSAKFGLFGIAEGGIEGRFVKVPINSGLLKMILLSAGDGWKPPLKDLKALEVKIHRGTILSGPLEVIDSPKHFKALIDRFPESVAMEEEGEGLFAAAHDLDIPCIVIKGISDHAGGRKSKETSWRSFASVMAASLTAHILSDAIIFQNWPHFPGTSFLKQSSTSGSKEQLPSPLVKEGIPSDEELERLSLKIAKWKPLARRLLESSELESLHKDNEKWSEKAFAMLIKWKQKNASKATYRCLYDALCHDLVSRKDLAEEFCCLCFEPEANKIINMASSTTSYASTKETTNFARLCRLLVDVGSHALRNKFDSIHPPANLHGVLRKPPAHPILQALRKKRILNPTQWAKLYPSSPSSVSSKNFDIILLTLLLRNICGLFPPPTGWDSLPPAADTSAEANIARVKYYRNHFFVHASQTSVDDTTFNTYWQDISNALVGLGEDAATINTLKTQSMDPVIEKRYQELLRECKKDDDNSKDRLDEIEVPLDIQARGPLATEVYNRELKEGQGYARRVPIMIIGQARTGKTSLKRSLKGELFDPNEGSTEGIETDPSYFKVTTDVWRTGSNSEDTETEPEFLFDRQLAQIIFKGLKEKERLEDPSRSGTKPSVKGFKVVEPSEANSPPTDSKVVDNANAPSLRTEVSVEPEELKTSSSVIDQIESDPSTQDSKDQQKVPENVAALVQELLKDNKKFMEGDDMYSVIWDFGGQSVFYDTRPIFLTEKAIYILAYDLSRDPYQKADAPVKQGMYEDIEDTDCQKTNFDYPDFWMSSIYSLVSKNTNRQKTSSLEKLPPVFLVCTHADEPYTKKGNPSKEIYGVLKDKIYRNLLKDFFVVDNTKSGSNDECQGVKKLRESVLSVAKDLPQMKEKIPLKWLKYEKVSYLLMSKGRERIFIEEARQVAVDECGIDDDVTFRTVLNFLHDQKVLINFNELLELESMVILNPQWLVDVFKEVITFKSFNPPENTVESFNTTENSVERLWKDFETTRILDTKVLDHTWGRFIDDQETCRSLIAIMERFSLLCPWPSQGTTELYLVPSMLRSPPTGDVLELLASARIPSLFVRFDSRRVPPGLFLRLILLFHKWSQERWMSPIKPVLFNNFALFHVCPHNATSLVVLCHSSSIEIVFCVGDGVGLAEEASFSCGVDLNVSRDIHRQMRLFLECMRKEFFWLEHMRYEMCVSCPVCSLPKESSKCRKHRVRGCDCLHLLSELEMQNLPYCKRPVVCGDRRIFKAMFVPWFSFLDEQEGRISLTKVCC